MSERPLNIDDLTPEAASAELARLAADIAAANVDYHTLDAPRLSDADYDALKRWNAAVEARFPDLKRADSPSELVGGALGQLHPFNPANESFVNLYDLASAAHWFHA